MINGANSPRWVRTGHMYIVSVVQLWELVSNWYRCDTLGNVLSIMDDMELVFILGMSLDNGMYSLNGIDL